MDTKDIVRSSCENTKAYEEQTDGVRWSLAVLQNRIRSKACTALISMRARLSRQAGQGTTEYAILVGVIVVIAILAITVFRPKLQELWDAIANGINSL